MNEKGTNTQIFIEISEATPATDAENPYAILSVSAVRNAMKTLGTGGAFALWMYFATNSPGYRFALSQIAVQNATGMKKGQYHAARKMLIDCGYLEETGLYALNNMPIYVFSQLSAADRREAAREAIYAPTPKPEGDYQKSEVSPPKNRSESHIGGESNNSINNTTINKVKAGTKVAPPDKKEGTAVSIRETPKPVEITEAWTRYSDGIKVTPQGEAYGRPDNEEAYFDFLDAGIYKYIAQGE